MRIAITVLVLMAIALFVRSFIERGRGFWSIIHVGPAWVMQAATMAAIGWLTYEHQKEKYDTAAKLPKITPEILDLFKPLLNYFRDSQGILIYTVCLLIVFFITAFPEMYFNERTNPSGKPRKWRDSEGDPTRSYIAWIVGCIALGYLSVQSFLYFHAISSGIKVEDFARMIMLPTAVTIALIIVVGGVIHEKKFGTLRRPRTWDERPIATGKREEARQREEKR